MSQSYLAARFIANGLNNNLSEYGTCVNASGEDRPCVMDKVKLQTHLVDIIDKLIAENEDQEVTEEPLGKKTEENEELAELKKIHDEIKAAADDTVLQKIVDQIEGSTKLLADKIEENKKKAEIAISNRRINPESVFSSSFNVNDVETIFCAFFLLEIYSVSNCLFANKPSANGT